MWSRAKLTFLWRYSGAMPRIILISSSVQRSDSHLVTETDRERIKVELLWNNWVQVSKPLCSTWEKLSECNGEQWQIALQRCALRVLLIMFRRIEVCRLKALEQYKVLIIYSLRVCRTNEIGVCCFELKYRRRSLLRRRVFDLAIIRFYRLVSSATKRAQGM